MRRNPPAKWVLPLVVNPATSTEWCVPVPDDPYHRAAFLGALQSLGSAYKWQDDTAHTAKAVAQVWRDIADNLERCMLEPETIVVEEWSDELAICESLRWNDGILEGFCCGAWTPIDVVGGAPPPGQPNQPSGTTRPSAGSDKCYNVTLSASNRWQLPFAVLPGDTVTISNLSGTWSDGGISPWYTPDGHTAIFGSSTGAGQGHDGGDPFATPYHMALVAFTVAENWQAQTDSPFVIGGSGSQQLTLQANDGSLDDNSGSISFTICVENGATPPPTEWCYFFDFTVSDYGFIPSITATYVPGVGFQTANAGGDIMLAMPLPGQFTGYTVYFATDGTDFPCNGAQQIIGTNKRPIGGGAATTWHDEPCDIYAAFTETTFDGPFSIPTTDVVEISWYNTAASFFNITGIEFRGTGANPFGPSNC